MTVRRAAATILANVIAASPVWSPRMRVRILRLLGVRIDAGARIYPFLRFVGNVDFLTIGRGVFLNAGILIGSNAPVVIGNRVSIGPSVQLLPTSHELGTSQARAGRTTSAPIRIGDGSWVGASAIVLGGVTIGEGCVIAAGAVVTSDCESDSMYGGVPARLIRRLGE